MANTKSISLVASSSQKLTASSNTDFDLTTSNNRTFEMWVKTSTNVDGGGLINRWDGSSKNLLVWTNADGTVRAYAGSGSSTLGSVDGTTDITDGGWHHVAITWDSDKLRVYIDGTLEGTSASLSPTISTSDLSYGQGNSSSYIDALIDDLRIWSTTRTQTQIDDNKDRELDGDETGLTHYWKLNNSLSDETGSVTLTNNGSATFNSNIPFADSPLVPADWGRKCAVTIDNTKVSGSSDLTDFRALVTEETLPSEMFDADGSYPALSTGADIRFTSDAEGTTELAFEIEEFTTDNDPANGTAAIWVKIPTLSYNTDTTIYVWYNNPDAVGYSSIDTYGSENVWGIDYGMVAHLEETSGQYLDSTSNGIDSSSVNTTARDATAKIGQNAPQFSGGGQDIDWGNVNDVSTGDLTLSAWMKVDNGDVDNVILGKKRSQAGASEEGYQIIQSQVGDGDWLATVSDGSDEIEAHGGVTTADTWKYIAMTYDGSEQELKLYQDGVLVDTQTNASTGTLTNTDSFKAGEDAGGFNSFPGYLDEIRFSRDVKTVEQLLTEFNNQDSPSTFASAGTPETPGSVVAFLPKIIMF